MCRLYSINLPKRNYANRKASNSMIQSFGRIIKFWVLSPFYDSRSHLPSLFFRRFRLDLRAEPSIRMVVVFFSPSFLLSFILDMRSPISQAGHRLTKLQTLTLNFCLESLGSQVLALQMCTCFMKCLGSSPGRARQILY